MRKYLNKVYKKISDNTRNAMKYMLLYLTYNNFMKDIAYHYIQDPKIHMIIHNYGDDVLGSFTLCALYKEILKDSSHNPIRDAGKYTFLSLGMFEALQHYHILPGYYDEKDFLAYLVGIGLYFSYKYLINEEKEKDIKEKRFLYSHNINRKKDK